MVFEKVRSIVSDELNIPENEITLSTSFLGDLNADSLDIYQLVTIIEEEFDIELSDKDIDKITRVNDIVDYINEIKGID